MIGYDLSIGEGLGSELACCSEHLLALIRQPRFTKARFAYPTNDLALTPADLRPTRLQQRQLLLPALQGCVLS